MKISHIALHVLNLEEMCNFYEVYFGAKIRHRSSHPDKGISVCFLTLSEGTYIEFIQHEQALEKKETFKDFGLAHIGLSVGSVDAVNRLSLQLEHNGYKKINGPCYKHGYLSDRFYAVRFLDPEDNMIEVMA